MTRFRFILASLRHYRRIHVAVALGVAVATAVLTGALVVGDSVRGSLRDLTLQRLGYIDSALVTGHLFRAALAEELASDQGFTSHFTVAEPAILLSATLQTGSGESLRRATAISVVGCRRAFWSIGQGGPPEPLADDQIALTEPIARELDVAVGDRVLLRIPVAGAIPADSPLGEKTDTSLARSFTVAAVLPPEGLSRFALAPSQHLPRNVFVPLGALQELLDKPGTANAILVASDRPNEAAGEEAQRALRQALRPRLEDYGLRVEQVTTPTEHVQISADQLVLPDAAVRAAERAFADRELQPVVTYLANTIRVGSGDAAQKIPYSTISGVDSTAALGPLLDTDGQPIRLADDEIVLNRWAADDLQAEVGDTVTITFYEPESTHGRLREREPPPELKLAAIVPLETADGEPTPAADPKLTPVLPGVTDQESINDWDLPFELVEPIRREDEDYWDEYRTTPKAFVSLATAKRLWLSRWGTISLLRIPLPSSDVGHGVIDGVAASAATNIADQLAHELDPADLGMAFLSVKQQGLAASSGTTAFDMLFLGFSFFLIASAVMLIAILFQLGVEQRAREVGTLTAAGVGRSRIVRLLGREGLIVAAVGATIGIAAGVFYAWIMITGLRTWWVEAVGTPFLALHATPRSLVIGWVAGVVVSWLAILWSIRRLARQSVNRLLSGTTVVDIPPTDGRRPRWQVWPIARIALAVIVTALCALGFTLRGEAQAGTFFATGAAVLVLLLGEIRWRLRGAGRGGRARHGFSMAALSALNTARHPGRSTLTIGLVAAASFLIVAISAFRLETGEEGTGGFELLATTDRPIHYDLNTPEGRLELGFSDEARRELDDWWVYSLRVAAGEDASCLNLYRPTQPRVLGVPQEFIERGGFAWAAAKNSPPFQGGEKGRSAVNPWTLLDIDLGNDATGEPIVPVVLDANTAIYSLHLAGVGSRLTIRDAADQPVRLEVVGLLKNSVLQGNLLLSEEKFLRLFPDIGGYRFFMIERVGPPRGGSEPAAGDGDAQQVPLGSRHLQATLESTLAADGFDAVDAREQLAQFLAVQNTYLSTFQSLGALGLLLGTIGLAVVQLRSVLERRGELALMRAAGFRRRRLSWMVICENGLLLLGGLAVGCVAAAVALVPQWLPREANVPWRELAALLAIISVVGLVAGWLATRSALRAPILPALRGD